MLCVDGGVGGGQEARQPGQLKLSCQAVCGPLMGGASMQLPGCGKISEATRLAWL